MAVTMEDPNHILQTGREALQASMLAATKTIEGIQHHVAHRTLQARQSVAELDAVVEEERKHSCKRLAPTMLELCEFEAYAVAGDANLAAIDTELKVRQGAPWGQPAKDQSKTDHIRLCVGGALFETSSTILRSRSLWFQALLSGVFPIPLDSEGAIFIDRDWDFFPYVLKYIRDGLSSMHADIISLSSSERHALLEEAAFYKLDELIGACAHPSVGSKVTVKLSSKYVADIGITESLLHTVCGRIHPPGRCKINNVACGILGFVALQCDVRSYSHAVHKAETGSGDGHNTPHALDNMGAQNNTEAVQECESCLGVFQGMVDLVPTWTLEYHGHTIKATANQFVQESSGTM